MKIARLNMMQKLSNIQRFEIRRVKELLKPRSVLKRTQRVARFPEILKVHSTINSQELMLRLTQIDF